MSKTSNSQNANHTTASAQDLADENPAALATPPLAEPANPEDHPDRHQPRHAQDLVLKVKKSGIVSENELNCISHLSVPIVKTMSVHWLHQDYSIMP